MATISVPAWAKVNLYLHVTGRRDDGYHLLDSLVAFAGIGDTVTADTAQDLELVVDGPMAPLLGDMDGDNLVLRAARALAQACGVAPRARLTLTKRLPVAAGIGGGSADAAATLRALMTLWGVDPAADKLRALALSLGADVPVCLRGSPTRMFGIGDRLAPAPPLPAAWLVLVNPMIGLSTPAVFKARRGCFSDAAPLTRPPADATQLAADLQQRRNDLTQAATSLLPAIDQALALLQAQPDCLLSRMSGSGATCFGLFATPSAAHTAATRIQAIQPDWWTQAAELLSPP